MLLVINGLLVKNTNGSQDTMLIIIRIGSKMNQLLNNREIIVELYVIAD
jgi:hypothetical protein